MNKTTTTYIPRSEDDVYASLSKAKNSIGGIDPSKCPYSANTIILIDNYMNVIESARADRNEALHTQTHNTHDFHINLIAVKNLTKFFINTLNNLISINKRPINNGFVPSDRQYYGLGTYEDTLPKMTTIAEILNWANKIIKGEEKRVAAGGTPITAPEINDIETYLNIAKTKQQLQSNSKTIYLEKQKIVTDLTATGIATYKEMRSECEFFFRKLEIEQYRNQAVIWGMLFKTRGEDSDKVGTLDGYITCDDVPVDNVTVKIVELDMILHSNQHGYYVSEEVPVGIYTIEYDKEGYGKVILNNIKISPDTDNEHNVKMEIVLE